MAEPALSLISYIATISNSRMMLERIFITFVLLDLLFPKTWMLKVAIDISSSAS